MPLEPEKPFRDELLSIERLEERATALAARFTLDPTLRSGARKVFARLDDNARVLSDAYQVLSADVHRGEFVSSAADWLLDNFHVVASQIREVRRNLPRGYYRELPKLASRTQGGEARVHALAVELIRNQDSRLDQSQLTRFMNSFQTVAPLTIGELWAWPSMVQLALVENLRRLAEETLAARTARRAADEYVAALEPVLESKPMPLPRALHPAFVVQLLQRVREYGPKLAMLRDSLEAHFSAAGMIAEEAIRGEHQREAASQVSVANVITSLRLCAQLNWSDYVESVSLVERILLRDPAGVHGKMDFLSRDRYRQVVEELSPSTGEGQVRVALRAVESAREASDLDGPGARAAHVGYHLIGKGRRGLESDLAYHPSLPGRMRRAAFVHMTAVYLGFVALFTGILIGLGMLGAKVCGGGTVSEITLAALLLLPASEVAIANSSSIWGWS